MKTQITKQFKKGNEMNILEKIFVVIFQKRLT